MIKLAQPYISDEAIEVVEKYYDLVISSKVNMLKDLKMIYLNTLM